MIKYFWVLPVFLRFVTCAPPAFSVHNDLLAFPQYEVTFPNSFVSLAEAISLLASAKSPSYSGHHAPTGSTHDGSAPSDLSQGVNPHQYQASMSPPSLPSSHDTYERMVFEGIPHLCTIPYVAPSTTLNTTAPVASEEEQQAELARATNHGLELLKDMQGQCIYYSAGWWVYSFCYNDGIRQFHPLPPGRGGVPMFPPVADRNVHSYMLGKFPPTQAKTPDAKNSNKAPTLDGLAAPAEAAQKPMTDVPQAELNTDTSAFSTSSQLQTRGSTSFLVQKLNDGTICDLTGAPRRIEVQFHCNPTSGDRIHMIKETASCVYFMVIHTPRLCNDIAFLPPQEDKRHLISCLEIIENEEKERSWHDRTAEAANLEVIMHEQESFLQAQLNRPLVIGGIVVGGHQWVGSTPELTIKASNIVGATSPQAQRPGGGEKYIATLAKSDGRYTSSLSEKEMASLGLKGTKSDLEKWIQEMQDSAGEGVTWKLDVVRTATGLEFRGIVMPKFEETQKKQDAKTNTAGAGAAADPFGGRILDDGGEDDGEAETGGGGSQEEFT